jgi:hypothetical protein
MKSRSLPFFTTSSAASDSCSCEGIGPGLLFLPSRFVESTGFFRASGSGSELDCSFVPDPTFRHYWFRFGTRLFFCARPNFSSLSVTLFTSNLRVLMWSRTSLNSFLVNSMETFRSVETSSCFSSSSPRSLEGQLLVVLFLVATKKKHAAS